MVKINYILSGLYFWLERLNFSSNFLYFCSVFLCDCYHFRHVSRTSGHMNFPKFWDLIINHGGPSSDTDQVNLPLTSSIMLACLYFSKNIQKALTYSFKETGAFLCSSVVTSYWYWLTNNLIFVNHLWYIFILNTEFMYLLWKTVKHFC